MARKFLGGKPTVGTTDTPVVIESRTITATAPVTIAGTTSADLSADRTIAVSAASTSAAGVVQLSDSYTTTGSTKAATETAVKAAYDIGAAAVPKTSATAVATFSKSGTLSTGTGTFRWYNDSGATMTLGTVRASVGTAPTGASLICDVNVDGTTIYSTQANRPTIAASGFAATGGTKSTTTIANASYLSVDIDQVGSTVAGADLTVSVWLSYA